MINELKLSCIFKIKRPSTANYITVKLERALGLGYQGDVLDILDIKMFSHAIHRAYIIWV